MPGGAGVATNPGWEATEDELRALDVAGYHAPQQFRTVETTRKLVAAGWDLMAEHPTEPLRLEEVLARSATAASSFYARFDSVRSLVDAAGLLALGAEERTVAEHRLQPAASDRAQAVAAATTAVFAPITQPGQLPREVLASGLWSDGYTTARTRARSRALHQLAATVGDAPDSSTEGAGAEVQRGATGHLRTLTWLHLVSATVDVAWTSGSLVLDHAVLADLADRATLLGQRLLAPSPEVVGAAHDLDAGPPPRVARRPITGHSDRGAQAIAELRTATHQHLVAHGRDLSPADIAASVHRSRSAFFDAFGTTGAALADLARAEAVARIPTEVFRPRPDVGPQDLVVHLAHRIRAWQDQQGITGRRLLQAATVHRELAAEVVGQLLDSAELLTGWYAPVLDQSPTLTRLLFVVLLASEQHQVVWGNRPAVVAGPDALAALVSPVVSAAT